MKIFVNPISFSFELTILHERRSKHNRKIKEILPKLTFLQNPVKWAKFKCNIYRQHWNFNVFRQVLRWLMKVGGFVLVSLIRINLRDFEEKEAKFICKKVCFTFASIKKHLSLRKNHRKCWNFLMTLQLTRFMREKTWRFSDIDVLYTNRLLFSWRIWNWASICTNFYQWKINFCKVNSKQIFWHLYREDVSVFYTD